MIAGVHELAAIAVVDEDVAGLDAGGLELVDDLENDLERRMGVRLTVGDDLDADHVARLEEVLPALRRHRWRRSVPSCLGRAWP